MQIASQHAVARADERVRARPGLLERRLARFQRRFRPQVLALAARHPRLKDLALSFPALLFALAVPRAGFDPEPVIARVIAGAPLPELGALAHVPMWLRRVAPEALGERIPKLPDGEFVRRQIVNHLPRQAKALGDWLQAVSDAFLWCDESMAVWIAQELARNRKLVKLDRLHFVCLWAWYAKHQQGAGVFRVRYRWSQSKKFDAALQAAEAWWQDIELHLVLGRRLVSDTWLQPGHAGRYKFVPLRSAADILEEASAMGSCLAAYGKRVAVQQSRLWSVKEGGQRVATLEIAFRRNEPLPDIVQLKMAQNKEAPREIWLAARQWLNAQDLSRVQRDPMAGIAMPIDRNLWLKLWRPYWLARQHIPSWLPLTPCHGTLQRVQDRRAR